MPTSTEPRYLRTAQVAELLHVSPKTVSRWAQEGRLRLLSLRQLPMATIFAARSTAQTADSRPRQRRGRHQTAEHACRWNLASGLDLRGRVTRATPPVVGQMGTNRDVAGALERGPPDLVNALPIQHAPTSNAAAFLRTLLLLLQPRHPAAKLTQFLAFGGGQPSAAVAIVRVASAQPVAKRLLGNAQLLGHFADRLAAGADQPDRLSAELQRIGGRVLGTWTPLRGSVVPSVEMSTRPDRINSSPRPTLFGAHGAVAGRQSTPASSPPCGRIGPGAQPRRCPRRRNRTHAGLPPGQTSIRVVRRLEDDVGLSTERAVLQVTGLEYAHIRAVAILASALITPRASHTPGKHSKGMSQVGSYTAGCRPADDRLDVMNGVPMRSFNG